MLSMAGDGAGVTNPGWIVWLIGGGWNRIASKTGEEGLS
jgi:hypothetical protein